MALERPEIDRPDGDIPFELGIDDLVVGGGNSAGQATVFLSHYAARVTLVVREPELGVNMSRYLAERIGRLENVEVLLRHELRELLGVKVDVLTPAALPDTFRQRVLETINEVRRAEGLPLVQ